MSRNYLSKTRVPVSIQNRSVGKFPYCLKHASCQPTFVFLFKHLLKRCFGKLLRGVFILQTTPDSSPQRASQRLYKTLWQLRRKWVPLSNQWKLEASKREEWAPSFICLASETLGVKHTRPLRVQLFCYWIILLLAIGYKVSALLNSLSWRQTCVPVQKVSTAVYYVMKTYSQMLLSAGMFMSLTV